MKFLGMRKFYHGKLNQNNYFFKSSQEQLSRVYGFSASKVPIAAAVSNLRIVNQF